MRERYSPLPSEALVFRTIQPGKGFLPPGHELPLPAWLEPNDTDANEAAAVGRVPGLSVWDASLTSFPQACAWRRKVVSEQLGFGAEVGRIRRLGVAHGRSVDVVADPLDVGAPEWVAVLEQTPEDERAILRASGEGHSLVEGIKRDKGSDQKAHRDFRDALAGLFNPL